MGRLGNYQSPKSDGDVGRKREKRRAGHRRGGEDRCSLKAEALTTRQTQTGQRISAFLKSFVLLYLSNQAPAVTQSIQFHSLPVFPFLSSLPSLYIVLPITAAMPQFRMPQFRSEDIPDLYNQVIIVTGGNAGLGLETVRQLSTSSTNSEPPWPAAQRHIEIHNVETSRPLSQIWAAVSPDAESGQYYGPVGKAEPGPKASQNRNLQEELFAYIRNEVEGHVEKMA